MSIKFRFLTGNVDWATYGGKWVSQKCNNGDFDYYLVRELINLHYATGDGDCKYCCQLTAIAPTEFLYTEEAISRCRLSEEERTTSLLIEAISEYQGGALVWQDKGNNWQKLFRECNKQANLASYLFGFYMDKPQNRLGATGWDFLKGEIGMRLLR